MPDLQICPLLFTIMRVADDLCDSLTIADVVPHVDVGANPTHLEPYITLIRHTRDNLYAHAA